MKFWAFNVFLAIFIWSCLYDRTLLAIYLGLAVCYLLGNTYYKDRAITSFRRKMQIATWNDSGDPTVRSVLEVELEPLDEAIAEHNAAHPDNKLTYTAFFVKAVAEGMALSGRTGGTISFGKFVADESIDISVLVDVGGDNLGTATIRGCNFLSAAEIGRQCRQGVKELKLDRQEDMNRFKRKEKFIPGFLLQALLPLSTWFAYDLDVDFPPLDVRRKAWGIGVVSNVSAFGIHDATAPLLPFMKSVFVTIMNTPTQMPVVRDGRIVVRKIMRFNISFDHRFADGAEGAKIVRRVAEVLKNPRSYL